MKPGDVYWIVDEVRGKQVKHLHVVLTHPEPDAGGKDRVAVVNISTVRTARYDKTMVLQKSDHETFVEQQYYVVYSEANFEFVQDLKMTKGYASASKALQPSIFDKVFDGLFAGGGLATADVRDYCSKRVGPNTGQVLDLKGK
jgi:hypothetical protein